jgi:lipopolysaccharide export system permease protein
MKIFFRYLMAELAKPFLFCLLACSCLWIVADLFGSLDEFFENKAPWGVVAEYYVAQLPKMLVMVLPVAILFASLFTLLQMSKHQELVGLLAGGVGPWQIFTPFLILAAVITLLLFYVVSGPANHAEAKRTRILREIKNTAQQQSLRRALVYADHIGRRVWYMAALDHQTGQAQGIEILQRDEAGADVHKYFAARAEFTGKYWRLTDVKKIILGSTNHLEQTLYPTLDLEECKIEPRTLALIQAPTDELSLGEISSLLKALKDHAADRTAPYYTQIAYFFCYPLCVPVMMLFAFSLGTVTGRRGAAAGVFNAIFILLGFLFLMNFFLAMGRGNRIPAWLAGSAAPLIFAAIALALMAQRFGWIWHFTQWLQPSDHSVAPYQPPAIETQRWKQLRSQSHKLMIERLHHHEQHNHGDSHV